MNLPIYDVVLGDLTAISLVEHPAIEEDFQCFASKTEVKLSYNDEKMVVFGPAVIADKPIYREDNGRGYYLIFSGKVIEKLFEDFMQNKAFNFNLEHSNEQAGVFLLESFIKRPGLIPEGFEEVADGSWFISLKVTDPTLWERIKAGEFNGFSIEAFVDIKPKNEFNDFINDLVEWMQKN